MQLSSLGRNPRHLCRGGCQKYDHPILDLWLKATTCHCYWVGRSVLFENNDYIVLKHNSHAAYAGRFGDSGGCHAYAELYRKADLVVDATGYNRNLFNGDGELMRWEGRIAKSRVLDDCRQMGIEFEASRQQAGDGAGRSEEDGTRSPVPEKT